MLETFNDESYRFFWLILAPANSRNDYHDVMREYQTMLVWKIGNLFFVVI
jgi:hypothetical protein